MTLDIAYINSSEQQEYERASQETEQNLLPRPEIDEVIRLYDIPDARFVDVVLCLSDHPHLVQVLFEAAPRRHALGALVEIPAAVGKRHEPVIKEKGVPVWVIVAYATKHGMTPRQISQLWKEHITVDEVEAALVYWLEYPEAVEDKLSDEE
jgi:uncharacterized protein (DUF433 family)